MHVEILKMVFWVVRITFWIAILFENVICDTIYLLFLLCVFNTAIPQQLGPLYLVPSDSPHTTKYTCEGTNYAGNMKNTASASVIVVVESEIQSEMMFLCWY